MRTIGRAVIAIAVVLTVLLVRSHVESISQPQTPGRKQASARDYYVLDNSDAYIELVSADTTTSPSYNPTRHKWVPTGRPTPPVVPDKIATKQIPVRVPGAEWAGQDPFLRDWMSKSNPKKLTDSQKAHGQQLGPLKYGNVQKLAPSSTAPPRPKITPKSDRIIVLGRMSYEDADWLEDLLPEWQHAVYVVDDPYAARTVDQNKGKESNVYLKYILDNYDNMPEYMVFLHAHQYSSHTEFWEQDNVLTVQRLQLDYLKKVGYLNLRCDWGPGCPEEVQPFRQLAGRTTELAFAGAWMKIFNNTNVPEIVATPCCAQFAVTKQQILQRPRSDYEHYHHWLMTTQLDDETSGRVFEYLWHIIFGQDPVFCPSKAQCYRDVYDMDYEGPNTLVPPDPFDEIWADWPDDDVPW